MPDQKRTRTGTRPDVNLGPDIAGDNASLPAQAPKSQANRPGVAPELRSADPAQSRARAANVGVPDQMRGMLDRLNRLDREGDLSDEEARRLAAGDTEPETTTQNLPAVIRTDLARIGRDLATDADVNPEWHSIKHLPGFLNRKIRGMGQDIFSMFTRTLHQDIRTIANVNGQGPNTEKEIKTVLGWLMKNAEALPESEIDFGQGLPGYKPQVREFRTENTRFHVVRDPAGWYVYAYPEEDAVTHGGPDALPNPDADEPERDEMGALIPRRLKEDHTMKFNTVSEQIRYLTDRLTNLAEQAELDSITQAVFEETMLDESTLAKLLGNHPGARELVHTLHSRFKLASGGLKTRGGNWAKNIEPNYEVVPERLHAQSIKASKDNFAIIVGTQGVAGIKPLDTDWDASKSKERDNTMRYVVVWATGDGQADHEIHKYRLGRRDATGGTSGMEGGAPNLFQVLQTRIGPTVDVYRAVGAVERGKMQQRADIAKSAAPNINQIGDKVKPVLMKLLQGTVGQLGPRIQKLAQAGNYEAVEKLTRAGKKLQGMVAALDTPTPNWTDWSSPLRAYGDIIRGGIDELTQGMDAAGKQQFMVALSQGQAQPLGQLLDYIRARLFTIS